jgi:tetratricopeptide (TPR) repeat protein
LQAKAAGARIPDDVAFQGSLARLLATEAQARGALDEARAYAQRAVTLAEQERNSSALMKSLSTLSWAMFAAGKLDEALSALERAWSVAESTQGKDHPEAAYVEMQLGRLLAQIGRERRGIALLEHALSVEERAVGPESTAAEDVLNALGEALIDVEPARALALLERSVRIAQHRDGDDPIHILDELILLGRAKQGVGRIDEAERDFRTELALLAAHPDIRTPTNVSAVKGFLAHLLLGKRRLREAYALSKEALDIERAQLGENHFSTAEQRALVGEIALALGRPAEARAALEPAVAVLRRTYPGGKPSVDNAERLLARALRRAKPRRAMIGAGLQARKGAGLQARTATP